MSLRTLVVSMPSDARRVVLVQFLTALGYFSVIPFFVVYMVKGLGQSPAFAAGQLTLFLSGQYAASFAGAYVSHRATPLFTMKIGLVLQIATYVLFATGVSSPPALCALSLALGVSKAFFTPAAKAALVALTPATNHYLLFSFRSTVNNLGVALGSSLGAALIDQTAFAFFLFAACIQAVALGVLHAVRAPSATPERPARPKPDFGRAVRAVMAMPLAVVLMAVTLCYQFHYIQLEYAFPLIADSAWGTDAVAHVFWVNAAAVMALQIPLNTWLSQRLPVYLTLALGFTLMCLAFGLLAESSVEPVFLAGVLLFTLGEITIDPAIDALLSKGLPVDLLPVGFGVLGLMGLLGAVAGNAVASRFAGLGDFTLFWYINCALAAVAVALVTLYRRQDKPTFKEGLHGHHH
ncbi:MULTISPECIES: MFS transporter [unclassified Pseudomonas]|uniref:MFS transporter n=1 Tax=unclassified Pseudomonas TaxID=196821 RepID=UPI000BCBA000|nr:MULTISPECIES: MFS transporter [unclassified Pseudomonas]PVZ11394.1 MFS transporter [Pseudomonas sp. URIL14HWK12:I12]PVZ22392.1 MFS transporter [Pseudomonas sp. URIL14HWK12:I10]PVZ31484.1 MFS transporter [Pseudomonas sp. URIL14HWK12:I11]SNZ16435.1 Arabinose efflux permease [Pseudomonas sp. URIL14HWK12:I9]